MKQKEAFHALMSFEKPDVLCQFEWGYWPETVERWRGEGLPDGVEPWDDCGIIHYFRPPIEVRIFPHFEELVLEEDETSRVVRTNAGIVLRESKLGTRLPQFLKHPVSNREDFEAIKERLDSTTPGRYPDDWDDWVASAADSPHILCIGGRENGFFGWLRELMGLETLIFSYVDQPELVHEICRHQVKFLKGVFERALRDFKFDFVFMWEDMAFKNGPLISPAFFRTFMLPYYKEMVDFYKQMGAPWVTVDTDGNMTELIPLFMEAGIDGLLPFEVAAGMDVREVRRDFPDLRILGGIDKRALAVSEEATDRELEQRLPEMFRQSGFVPSLDHHVQPEVPYCNFKHYLRKCREIYQSVM